MTGFLGKNARNSVRIIFIGDTVLLYAGDELVAQLSREEYDGFSCEPTLEDELPENPNVRMWMLTDFDCLLPPHSFGSPKSDIVQATADALGIPYEIADLFTDPRVEDEDGNS